jgi:hypothetical protein
MIATQTQLTSGAGATLEVDNQATLMDVTTILTTVVSNLVSAGLSAGSVIQVYEMRQKKQKETATEKKLLGEAEINAQQVFLHDLLTETHRLQAFAQTVLDSQINYERQLFDKERTIDKMARDNRDLQRLQEEQHEEILLWKAKFEAKDREFEHLQKRVRELESGYERNTKD